LLITLFFGVIQAQETIFNEESNLTTDPLELKIQSFLSVKSYEANKAFIEAVFDPKSAYYTNERVDAVKVIETLKENGLLDLFFERPRVVKLDFKTNGSPIFFVKLMSDTLASMGYYKYVTTASKRDASEFVWSINLTSEYATDPLLLQQELAKRGCSIVDIQRKSAQEWSYLVDISHARLHVAKLQANYQVVLKRLLYEQWLDVSSIRELHFESKSRNRWYPYIAFFDTSMHLLKVIKKDFITKKMDIEIPKGAYYIKISDMYTLKNLKDQLILLPKGSR